MTHRLVTFLGIPPKAREQDAKAVEGYPETTYRLLDHQGNPTERQLVTPWIAVALARFFEPDEVYVISTEEAWREQPAGANRPNGEALRDTLQKTVSRVERVSIPTGLSSTDFWKQFQALKDSLRGDGLSELTLDITHGLRSQPFFASAVTTFVSFLDEQRPPLRVVYGAHDLIRTLGLKYAPVVDLSVFPEVLGWTHDITLFLKTGRVAGLAERSRALGHELRKGWAMAGREGKEPRLRELAEAIEAFARDLQTIRTGALLLGTVEGGKRNPSSAQRLLDAVGAARDDVQRHMPPLADVLERIEAMARPLDFAGDALVGEKARDALAALADLYLSMGRYVETITTLREARITARAAPAAACPGRPGFDDGERRLTEQRFWHEEERDRAQSIAQIRNDMNHAGYRADALSADKLIDNIRKQREAFDELDFGGPPHAERTMLNITNHPVASWSTEQQLAAQSLARHLVNVPFPEVRPEWGESRIDKEAERIAASLPPETTHALVQGEFTLTVALVKKLQARGIRCLAATTERRVERTADGREVREFRFVRFREYPKLA